MWRWIGPLRYDQARGGRCYCVAPFDLLILAAEVINSTVTGLVDIPSVHSVDETVVQLKRILEEKDIALFALVDHSGEAAKAGIKMLPTKLLIFGNPKAGTPLMLASPSIAIDLPLKILIWEDVSGKVWLTYNSPAYLQERHRVPSNLIANIAVIEPLVKRAAQ